MKKGELVVVTNELTTQIKFDKQDLIDVGVQSVVESAKQKLGAIDDEYNAVYFRRDKMIRSFDEQAKKLALEHELVAMFRKFAKGKLDISASRGNDGTVVVEIDNDNDDRLCFEFKHSASKAWVRELQASSNELAELGKRRDKLRNVIDNPAQFERKFKAALSAQRLKGSQEGEAMLEAITKSAELVAKDF